MLRQKINYKVVIIILLIIFVFIAFYNGLVVRNYIIKADKLLMDQSIKIVLISDLHSYVHGENQKKIVNKIKKQNPDIIALAGDIADDKVPIDGTILFLEEIKYIAPIFYVTGNHEVWSGELNYIKDVFRSFGVTVLENDYKEINISGIKLVIAGVDDPEIIKYERKQSNWYKEIEEAFADVKDLDGYKILISHRPEAVVFYNTLPFDLVLSGHSHGGQVRIPFLINGLLAPNQGFFPKYAGGVYELENYTHIVSRGVSFNPLLPRVFNPPEVVVIDVKR